MNPFPLASARASSRRLKNVFLPSYQISLLADVFGHVHFLGFPLFPWIPGTYVSCAVCPCPFSGGWMLLYLHD